MSFPVLHDDDDLLAVSKPAGVNTHRPGRSALAGIFEWLKAHGGAWSALSLPHRLDRETSGVLVFGKSRRANRSLAGQFAAGSVERVYELLSGAPGPPSGSGWAPGPRPEPLELRELWPRRSL
ncbi:MAG: hypothetical protein HY815_22540 [Candidatus Riflebacteria bacterium]|nr:hypothetical protein [Candidatus Riflebacteria bacterium]